MPQTRCDCGRKLARERGLYATYVSNGYMMLEALRMLREAGLDGLKVDVKGGIEEYRRFNSTLAEVVWRNAREAKRTGIHVEVVYPVVTGATDSENLVHETVEQHLKELGPECSILDRVVMHLRKHDVHVWAAVQ
ncbi:MAG: radical SAM protein, partial [Thermofilaceae archaeon]